METIGESSGKLQQGVRGDTSIAIPIAKLAGGGGDGQLHAEPPIRLQEFNACIAYVEMPAVGRSLKTGGQYQRDPARGLVEALYDRTVDGEPAARERCSTRPSEQAILDESQNLELFTQLSAV